ncbi:hypothetical protein HDE_07552 [Halotydeus destructor]|nr:hypothetical protein HDE_07552 [Halotydeus destructor]
MCLRKTSLPSGHLVTLTTGLALLSIVATVRSQCNMDLCSGQYADLVAKQASLVRQVNVRSRERKTQSQQVADHSGQYCGHFVAYNQCLTSITKPCRGHLQYHSLLTLLQRWIKQYNCHQFGPSARTVGPDLVPSSPSPRRTSQVSRDRKRDSRRRGRQERRRSGQERRDRTQFVPDKLDTVKSPNVQKVQNVQTQTSAGHCFELSLFVVIVTSCVSLLWR